MGTVSKVQSVTPSGHFDGSFGRMFKFNYVMEDGISIQANHKTETGFFAAGSEVEYNITKDSPQYGLSGKVGRVQDEQYRQAAPPVQSGGYATPPAPAVQSSRVADNKNASFALSYAKDLYVNSAEQYTDAALLSRDVIVIADEFLKWLNSK